MHRTCPLFVPKADIAQLVCQAYIALTDFMIRSAMLSLPPPIWTLIYIMISETISRLLDCGLRPRACRFRRSEITLVTVPFHLTGVGFCSVSS